VCDVYCDSSLSLLAVYDCILFCSSAGLKQLFAAGGEASQQPQQPNFI